MNNKWLTARLWIGLALALLLMAATAYLSGHTTTLHAFHCTETFYASGTPLDCTP